MRAIVVNPKDRPENIDPGPAPMLQWLRIDALAVDEDYQRELVRESWTNIRRIAQNFKWSRFSPVFVAPVEGGRYAIIDGQHRTHAAAICGFSEVPCQIVQMGKREQAESFAAVNGMVTKIRPGQVFKAALAAGDEFSLRCVAAVEAAGCRLMTMPYVAVADKKPGQIFALALVKKHVAAGREAMVTRALKALKASEGGQLAESWTGWILKLWLQGLADRPRLDAGAAALAGFLDGFDLLHCYEQAGEQAVKKRRMGFLIVSRQDLALAMLGETLDKAFARRAA